MTPTVITNPPVASKSLFVPPLEELVTGKFSKPLGKDIKSFLMT